MVALEVVEPYDDEDEPEGSDLSLILPEGFWQTRDVLGYIREYAHGRATCADGVLYAVLARLSAMVDPRCRVDTGIGSSAGASLNLFVAAVGASGTGKSTSAAVARNLYYSRRLERDMLPLGSGEGLAEAFMGDVENGDAPRGKDKKPPREQVRSNVFMFADEGEALTKMGQRNGATLGAVLRTAWMGETLGQTNAEKDRNRKVDDYALGIVIGFQPETVMPVLDDDATGMAQRFVYCSTADPTIPLEPPLTTPVVQAEEFYPLGQKLGLEPALRREIWDNHIQRNRYGGATRDAHKDLTRIKLAGLLALLDGRHVITADDWQLATVMWDTSMRVQNHYLAKAALAKAQSERNRTLAHVSREVETERALMHVRAETDPKLVRIATSIARNVHEKNARTVSAATRPLAGRDRVLSVEAVEYAVEQGWILQDEHAVEPGPSVPANT